MHPPLPCFQILPHLPRYPCWLRYSYSQTTWSDSSHVGSSTGEDEQQPCGNDQAGQQEGEDVPRVQDW